MTRIRVEPEALDALAQQLRYRSEHLRELGQGIEISLGVLEWEVHERLAVEDLGCTAIQNARSLAEQLDAMATFLANKANAFVDADATAIANAQAQIMFERIRHIIDQIIPPWMVPDFPIWALIELGSIAGGPVASMARTLLQPVDSVLRAFRGSDGTDLPPEVNLITGLAQIIGIKRVSTGSPNKDGWTAGYYQVKGDSLMGADAEVDALHYQTKVGDNTTVHVNVGHAAASAHSFFVEDGKLYGGLGVHAEASAVEADVDYRFIGNDDVNVSGEAKGNLVGAEGEAQVGLDGVKLKGLAYVAEGEVDGGFNFFDWKIKLGVKGCAVCAGGSIQTGSKGELELGALLGLGVTWDISSR